MSFICKVVTKCFISENKIKSLQNIVYLFVIILQKEIGSSIVLLFLIYSLSITAVLIDALSFCYPLCCCNDAD